MKFRKAIETDFIKSYKKLTIVNFIKFLINPSSRATFFVRCAQFSPNMFFWLFRNILITFYNIDFGKGCKIGYGLRIPHPIGIVFGGGCIIGSDFTIYQNVTIGNKNNAYPIIKDNVIIYCNSVIVGKIIIDDNVIVGALSFVDKSLTKGKIVR